MQCEQQGLCCSCRASQNFNCWSEATLPFSSLQLALKDLQQKYKAKEDEMSLQAHLNYWRLFLQGMENAVPKVILKMMNVDGITRENVASHLQKYRLHLRHQAGSRASRVDSGLGATACAAHLPPGTAQGVPIPLAAPLPMQPSSSAAGKTPLIVFSALLPE